jgi:hypothetical protein
MGNEVMQRSFKIIPTLFATIVVATVLAQASSCALDTYGTQTPSEQKPCNTAVDCDDGNDCTAEACDDKNLCAYTSIPNGASPVQTPGDCTRNDCLDGTPSVVTDDQDKPNDNEPCTTDACSGSTPSNTPLADGQMCSRGTQTGTCAAGICQISCSDTMPCNDSNPCTDDFCNPANNVCVFTNIDGLPTPGVPPVAGDCKVQLCVGGTDTAVNDDADVNIDGNTCTDDVCTAGVASNPDTAAGAYCQQGQDDVCSGNGTCVACTEDVHCVGIDEDECTKRNCVNNVCEPLYMGTDTLASPALQMAGDCQKVVCNGSGGTTKVADDADKPNDNNACTTDTCMGGSPKYTNVTAGTTCGAMGVCNAAGGCVGCNAPTDCQGTDDFCKKRTCINNVCGVQYTTDNTPLPTGQTSMDCKIVVCDNMGNTVTRADSNDPVVDNNQCTDDTCNGTTPSNPNKASGATCTQNGGDVCNGTGACKKSNGRNCAGGMECLSSACVDSVCCNSLCSGSCQACNLTGTVGMCTNIPKGTDDSACSGTNTCNGMGACKREDGQTCSVGFDCLNNVCSDGRCCATTCTGTCKSCNISGSEGQCVNIPAGQQDPNASTTCSGSNQCDGNGTCKKILGQTCGGPTECLSTFCVDGRCCENTCSMTCMACNIGGSEGQCTEIAKGTDDNNPSNICTGNTQSCDGMGGCKKENGQGCTNGTADCLSGFCADGLCCDTACTTTCMACNLGGANNGKCTNIAPGQDDNNPANACTGAAQSCNGMGACKKDDGQTCAGNTECNSTFCVDGVCCENACNTTCFSCNQATALGTCLAISSGAEDTEATTTCMGTKACDGSTDGANACKLKNGQGPCTTGDECLSGNCNGGSNKCQ